VEIRIDSEKYVVSGVPEYVSVTLEGKASILTPTARQKNFNLYVDLEKLGEGEHTVDIEHENVPNELSIYIEPKSVDITIEERATKEFPVSTDLINTDQLPEGFELGDPKVEPGTVVITSSQSVIDQVAVVKVFVDVAGVTEPINKREVPVNVYDSQGNELRVNVEPENVVVSVDVQKSSKKVPVKVPTTGNLPKGYSLTSLDANLDEVEVYATSDLLEEVSEIRTEEIDLSGMTKSSKQKVNLELPEGVAVPEVEHVEVNIEIAGEEEPKETKKEKDEQKGKKNEDDSDKREKAEKTTDTETSDPDDEDYSTSELTENEEERTQKKTIDNIPIHVENDEGEQNISFVRPSQPVMSLTVTGDEKDINGLNVDDFKLSIDVEGLDKGEHRLPVFIEHPEEVTVDGEVNEVVIEI